MDKIYQLLNEGRLYNVNYCLKEYYCTNDIHSLSDEDKLNIMCIAIGLDTETFDKMLADNSPVLRTVKGHAFEVAFEQMLKLNGYNTNNVGGDTDIDLEVNGYSLQLKTPNINGSTNNTFVYKTHKTHGAKSEKESMDYYHRIEDFADFFVGLISYSPFEVFIIPKAQLPKHSLDIRYIKSPFKLSTTDAKFKRYINNFKQIGVDLNNLSSTCLVNESKELLPLTSSRIGLKSHFIIDTILRECNFRIWDMSIKGFSREAALKSFLDKSGIIYSDNPTQYKPERGDKADIVIWDDTNNISFIQVKGLSLNNCDLDSKVIATETQLTRGRINDHPTQSRLYMETDFDYLILAIEPIIVYKLDNIYKWTFFAIPTNALARHATFNN